MNTQGGYSCPCIDGYEKLIIADADHEGKCIGKVTCIVPRKFKLNFIT
jgi:Ni,Fe-hydrogenase maturation factor